MTTTMKAPLRNCFQKFCVESQSPNTNTRLRSSLITASAAWPIVIPKAPTTW